MWCEWQYVALEGAVGLMAGLLGVLAMRDWKKDDVRSLIAGVACATCLVVLTRQALTPIVGDWQRRPVVEARAEAPAGVERLAAAGAASPERRGPDGR